MQTRTHYNVTFKAYVPRTESVNIDGKIYGFIQAKGNKDSGNARFEARVPDFGINVDAPTKAEARRIVRETVKMAETRIV